MQTYNAVPDAAVKTTPTGRRVLLAAALSFCLGALAATGAPASKALRGSTNLVSKCTLTGSAGTKVICGKSEQQCKAAHKNDKQVTIDKYEKTVSSSINGKYVKFAHTGPHGLEDNTKWKSTNGQTCESIYMSGNKKSHCKQANKHGVTGNDACQCSC